MDEQEQVIDLRVLLRVLLNHLAPIAIVAVAAAIIGFILSAFIIPKKYESSAMLYVESNTSQSSDSININDINAAQKIVSTCQVLFKNDYVITALNEALGNTYDNDALKGMISIEPVNSTQILSVTVTAGSPENAQLIAAKLSELSQAEFKRVIKNGSIEVVSEATLPEGHSYPSKGTFTAVALLLGLVGTYFIFLLIEIFDTKIKPDDDLAQRYGIPVFAEIVDFETADKSGYKYESYGRNRSVTKEQGGA